jgi:GH15 family glucan-1,4-alpha-glucosidase
MVTLSDRIVAQRKPYVLPLTSTNTTITLERWPHRQLPSIDDDLDIIHRHFTETGLMRASLGGDFYPYNEWERDKAQAVAAFREVGEWSTARWLCQSWLRTRHADNDLIEEILVAGCRPWWAINREKAMTNEQETWEAKQRMLQPIRRILPDGTTERHHQPPWYGTPQHDALAYFLREVCLVELHEEFLTAVDYELLARLTRYLLVVKCWEGDFGAWEQEYDIHASTLHALLASFDALDQLSQVRGDSRLMVPVEMRENCLSQLASLQGWHQPGKMSDGAHLLAYTVDQLGPGDLPLLERIIYHLWHREGMIRFAGDYYMRTVPVGATEARWTLISLLAAYAYAKSGQYEKANAMLRHIDAVQRQPDGMFPEAWVPVVEDGQEYCRPCSQTVLAWSHAIYVRARLLVDRHFRSVRVSLS